MTQYFQIEPCLGTCFDYIKRKFTMNAGEAKPKQKDKIKHTAEHFIDTSGLLITSSGKCRWRI